MPAVPVSALELADDVIALDIAELVLDATELALDELIVDETLLTTDELVLELCVDDCVDDERALLLDALSYAIGNNGLPWSEFF